MIDSNKLSDTTQDALNSLASISESLGLGTTELSNYYTAISKLSMDQMELDIEEANLNEIEYSLDKCQKSATNELENMKGILLKLQQDKKMTKHIETTDQLLKQTTIEYLKLEEKYNNLGIERKGTRLNHIYELDLKANSVENELKEKSDTLISFQVLPSEMVLASIKIQEMQEQLHELENEREYLFSDIAKSIA